MSFNFFFILFSNFLMMLIFSSNFIIKEKIYFFEFEIYSLNSTLSNFQL